MRIVPAFVVPAALVVASSALAGDSWQVVDDPKEAVAYEEVSDNVYMPKGLLETLPNSDQLLDLINETVTSEKPFNSFAANPETGMIEVVVCETFVDFWTDESGIVHKITLTVCSN